MKSCVLAFFLACLLPIQSLSVKEWRQNLVNSDYDSLMAPEKAMGRGWTSCLVQVYVESLGNFQATTMDYDLDIYFIQSWLDPRLAFTSDDKIEFNDKNLIANVWTPDIYFANSKSAQSNELTKPNLGMAVHPDGNVRYSMRVSLKVSCHMMLQAYPLDYQTCTMRMLPYMNTETTLRVRFAPEDPVIVDPDIVEADLKLTSTNISYCDGTYYGATFSCLLITFQLKRDLGSSLLQTYLPSFFIVVISWISFWIDPASVPGRVGLSVTTLLTLATQATGIQLRLPPVSYAKALDIWFGVCMLFLFGALLEFAVVNMNQRLDPPKDTAPSMEGDRASLLMSESKTHLALPEMSMIDGSRMEPRRGSVRGAGQSRGIMIDVVSRALFPLAFFAFNCLYWYIYLV